jgi:prenylcysteine oxidase/farnesylcysteine lyase
VLHDNLYYLSAIEWAASAMEMSAISAKNVANLIAKKWNATNTTDLKSQTGHVIDEL